MNKALTARPTISVIIPCFNQGRFLAGTVQSVLSQTQRANEILVVDDGSTDQTAEIAASLELEIRNIRQSRQGQGSARQRGLSETTSDYVMFLDADDELRPNTLEKLATALKQAPDAVVSYCRATLWKPDKEIEEIDRLIDNEGDVWQSLIKTNFIRTPGCALIKRLSLLAIGGWDADSGIRGNEDWELWLRLAEAGDFIRVTEPLLRYRVHPDSFSKSRPEMFRSQLAVLQKQRHHWMGIPSKLAAVRASENNARKGAATELWGMSLQTFVRGDLFRAISLAASSFRYSPARIHWMIHRSAELMRRARIFLV